jgi:hypothetical protein
MWKAIAAGGGSDPAVQTMFFAVFAGRRFKPRQGAAMKLVEITPRQRTRLYSALVKKEADIRGRGRGTFFRVGRKAQTKAEWKHKKFQGSIRLERGDAEAVTAKVRSSKLEEERQLLSSFLGFVDRHCGDGVSTILIQYK